jgi:hypothetical protein
MNNNKSRLTRILKSRANLFHFKALRKHFKALSGLKKILISLKKVRKIKNRYKILNLQKCPIINRKEMRS